MKDALEAVRVVAARVFRLVGDWLARTPRRDGWGSADVVVVFGAGLPRYLHGAAVYRARRARELWHTGHDPAAPTGVSTAERAARIAVESGVAPTAIRLVVSRTTWEDATETAALVTRGDVRSLVLVTDWYHGRRAFGALRRQLRGTGVRIDYTPATGAGHGPEDWWRCPDGRRAVGRELLKLGFYWVRYGVAPWERRSRTRAPGTEV